MQVMVSPWNEGIAMEQGDAFLGQSHAKTLYTTKTREQAFKEAWLTAFVQPKKSHPPWHCQSDMYIYGTRLGT